MKKYFVITCLFLTLISFRCEEVIKPTGSDDVHEISDLSFEVTEKTTYSTKLVAKGTVKNNGNKTIYPTWYVEGAFYSDSTSNFKLGGDYYSINYSLEPGETTLWILEFSSSLYYESDYPSFCVKNLRGYIEN